MKLLPLLSMMTRLSNLQRFSMERPYHPESVLEHTGFAALIAMIIAREVDVNLEEVIVKALIHDIDEIIVGDVPRPTKYSSPTARAMFDHLAEKGVAKIATDLRDGFPHFASNVAAKHVAAKRDRSGLVVAIVDVLAVVHTVWSEVIVRGNNAMLRQAFTAGEQLSDLRRRVAAEFSGEDGTFLDDLIADASELMLEAQRRERPIFGTMREDNIHKHPLNGSDE